MDLLIRLKNGQPFEHPIFADNFKQVFPEVDLNNLPAWVAKFIRVAPPTDTLIGPYETLECSYQFVDGVVADVWEKRQLTDVEKLKKQAEAKLIWPTTEIGKRFVSWVFNENTCTFEPPVPMPSDDKLYYWSEATLSWVSATPVVTLP